MTIIYPGLDDLLKTALSEDLGAGDVTTSCCVPETAVSRGEFVAKEPGVICGIPVLTRVFALLDERVTVTPRVSDGDDVSPGDVIAVIEGPSQSILSGERVALNFIRHLSGIATYTARLALLVSDTGASITDTRKTTPGLRALEKYAVRCGGGTNHRFNLSDGVLIKDNHIVASGGITNAINLARTGSPHTLKIEVETETMEQVQEALDAGADIIMLDNMSEAVMAEAVRLIDGRALTEASGDMGKRDLRAVAETGVDIISIGALTHSVTALDLSLKFRA